jgi:hypothetical protein
MYAVGSLSQGLQLLHGHFEDAQEAKSEAFANILARMDELDEDMNFIDNNVGTVANGISDVLGWAQRQARLLVRRCCLHRVSLWMLPDCLLLKWLR